MSTRRAPAVRLGAERPAGFPPLRLAPFGLAAVGRLSVGAGEMAGIDDDRAGRRIALAEPRLRRREHERQVVFDERAALVVSHSSDMLEIEVSADRFLGDAESPDLPVDPDVDERVGAACADRIVLHYFPQNAETV